VPNLTAAEFESAQTERCPACARGDRDRLIEYIKNQKTHHRKTAFEAEYRKLLAEAGIEFDER
jgi:hypothetical protein